MSDQEGGQAAALEAAEGRIVKAFEGGASSRMELAARLLGELRALDDGVRGAALRFVCYLWEDVDEAVEGDGDDDEDAGGLDEGQRSQLGSVADSMLEAILTQRPSEEAFYSKLWELVVNPFFSTDERQAFALYHMLIDKRVPYFEIGEGITMSNPEYRERRRALSESLARIRYVLNAPMDQKTQKGSLLLEVIATQSAPEDQAVLMAEVLNQSSMSQLQGLLGFGKMLSKLRQD